MNTERFMGGPYQTQPPKQENILSLSWCDSNWSAILNQNNVMDYFSERSNPFYDRTCNNENLKMQRLGMEHLANMVGVEYVVLHVQEPILYVIRKQHRHSPQQVTPLADYHIINAVAYQTPDMASLIGWRMVTMVHHLQSAFEEAASYAQYHPSKGYWWEFKDPEKAEKAKAKEEPGSAFQRRRVDILLTELAKRFPPKVPPPPQLEKQTSEETAVVKTEVKDIKIEKTDAPVTVTSIPVTTTSNVSSTTVPPLQPPPVTTVTSAQPQLASQRNSMKPPPEKKPRIA